MSPITNAQILDHAFLVDMYRDSYFPDFLVDRCVQIFHDLCAHIEAQQPATPQEVYVLTHAATERFNDINEDFGEHESELETAAREALAADFDFIGKAYGYTLDLETMIAPRDW